MEMKIKRRPKKPKAEAPVAALSAQNPRGGVEAAAVFAGLSVSAMNKHRVYGTGPKFSKLGRRVFYSHADVADWIAEHSHTSTAEYQR